MIYRFIVLTFEHVLQLQTISAQHESFESYKRKVCNISQNSKYENGWKIFCKIQTMYYNVRDE